MTDRDARVQRNLATTLPWLVADVGGTNTRFGWVDEPTLAVQHVRSLPTAQFAGPADAAADYLAALGRTLGQAGPCQPRRAAWAVASAVTGADIRLTNCDWHIAPAALQAALGLDRLLLLNDFEALALSLPHLTPAQWQPVGPGAPGRGVLGVIGPGTGMGVGAVLPTPSGWMALPGEGGHATLAPADDFESDLLQQVRRHYPHVSAERLLSGIGLPVLHQAVAAVRGQAAPTLDAPAIVALGLAGGDAVCRQTLDSFCALLGGFAGNVALTLGARGGLYIGGGIVPRLGEHFMQSSFRARFEAKGRFQDYLAAVPTAVITDTLAALTGAAHALAQDAV